jgi:hypothetical protein
MHPDEQNQDSLSEFEDTLLDLIETPEETQEDECSC